MKMISHPFIDSGTNSQNTTQNPVEKLRNFNLKLNQLLILNLILIEYKKDNGKLT